MTRDTDPARTAERRAMGMRLRLLRVHAGKTQADVAKALKVTRQTVGAWELGTFELAALDLARLADLFTVDANVILGRVGMPEIKAAPEPEGDT